MITWETYGTMYDSFKKRFADKEDFGYLMSQVTSLYLISQAESITDMYNITLETILEMGVTVKDKVEFRDFVKEFDFEKTFA